MNVFNFYELPKEAFPSSHRDVAHYIDDALERGGSNLTRKMIERGHELGERSCIIIDAGDEGYAVMSLEYGPGVVNVTILSGDLPKGWEETAHHYLLYVCRDHGASIIQLKGRKGWERFLKPLGYRVDSDGYVRFEVKA